MTRFVRRTLAASALVAACTTADAADAFCGFYVSGAEGQLYNNATMVVMMRDGTRTVLSMQNNYQGPPEDFAMVVPVPVVLQKENVKTLPGEIFGRIDKLAAPRLVEYWEQDPCAQRDFDDKAGARKSAAAVEEAEDSAAPPPQVKIEAQFEVGEYEIVILSANDSLALDGWLRTNKYNIPEGAEEVLKPYVEKGMKFFVAKVNSEKVSFSDGMAQLSPLRFHYDDDEFALPVRLGLLNAKDKQDLIVHILAKSKRYEVANYENVTIPTNIEVTDDVRKNFPSFYAALFDKTLEETPNAVVTEYSWDASTCDPCPEPALSHEELYTMGGDVLFGGDGDEASRATLSNVFSPTDPAARQLVVEKNDAVVECLKSHPTDGLSTTLNINLDLDPTGKVALTRSHATATLVPAAQKCIDGLFANMKFATPNAAQVLDAKVRITYQLGAEPPTSLLNGFVLTRLHARYDKSTLGEDLVFKEAKPIVGGREQRVGDKLETGATEAAINNFQGRYAIRHRWEGKIECKDPVRGVWGGPPDSGGSAKITPALDLAFAERKGATLASWVMEDVPEIKVVSEKKPKGPEKTPKAETEPKDTDTKPAEPPPDEGCGCRVAGGSADMPRHRGGAAFGLFLGAWALLSRRRRRVSAKD